LGSCVGGLSGRRSAKTSELTRTEDPLTEEFVVAIEAPSEKMSLAADTIYTLLDHSPVVLLDIVSTVEMESWSVVLRLETVASLGLPRSNGFDDERSWGRG
jgi:hypothetical protein